MDKRDQPTTDQPLIFHIIDYFVDRFHEKEALRRKHQDLDLLERKIRIMSNGKDK